MQHGVAEWLRLEGTSGDRLLRAESTRGDCSRIVPHWVLDILMDGETPHLFLETCSGVQSPLQ